MATCPTCREIYPNDETKCPADGAQLLPDAAFESADRDLQAGEAVGEYEVVGKIGQGGFGAVFEAIHPLIGKRVAIKVLKRAYSSDPEVASRFIAEARAVNQIEHRYIIDIFSFGRLPDGRLYYVMNLLDGLSLDDYLAARGRVPPEQALPILRAVAEAVDAAHQAGIAHRDLKPENVFVTRDGGIQLLDFGIAKLMTEDTGHKTQTGALIGTPFYMSPEQCRGRDVDHRTDIYSFGVVAFELLTGQRPFVGDDVMATIFQHLSEEPPVPSRVCPSLPRAFDEPLLQLLAKAPDDRPPTLTAGTQALVEAAHAAKISVPATLVALSLDSIPTIGHDGKISGLEPTVSDSATGRPRRAAASGATGDGKSGAPRAHAQTTSALMGAESVELAPRGRPRWILGAAAVAAVAAIGVIALALRGGSSQSAAVPPADAAPAMAALPVPDAAPVVVDAASVIDAAAPATVSLRVTGAPDGTEIRGPGGVLGKTPGKIEIPRGDAPMKIVLEHPRFHGETHEVTPSANVVLSVSMRRKRASRPGRNTGQNTGSQKPPPDKHDPNAIPDDPFKN